MQQQMGFPMGTIPEVAIANNMHALVSEAQEVLNEINWKPWRQINKEVNNAKVQEEIIDAFLFIINAAIEADLTPETFLSVVEAKQAKNKKRIVNRGYVI